MLSAALFTRAGTQVLLRRCSECPWWNVLCVSSWGWQCGRQQPLWQGLSHSTWMRVQQVQWEYPGPEKSPAITRQVWGLGRPKVKWRSQDKVKVQPGAVSLSYTSEENQTHLPVQWAEGVQVESPEGTAQTLLLTPSLFLWKLDSRLCSCVVLEQPLDVGKWTFKEGKRF